MAAATVDNAPATPGQLSGTNGHDEDVFSSDADLSSRSYHHRFSSRFDAQPLDLTTTASPSQLKRTIEAHLQETDRRLLDTQQLGNSLLKQRDDLSSKLEEVEQFQDEATIPSELRRRLADIEREHADVGREVARALIGPKAKQDEFQSADSGVFTSQATGSPTKVSAPSRRHRNQPSTRAGDLQFAADISTSLLAQVRQLQSAVAERDDELKRTRSEREAIEHDILGYTQKIRALDESEQKYKDENWNLETQKHDLLSEVKDTQDREKRLNAMLGSVSAERSKLQNDLDELSLAHTKLSEEFTSTRKAHDTEIHSLKRNADAVDTERHTLQERVDELVSQNQELAKAVATRSRSGQISPGEAFLRPHEETAERAEMLEDSPPPSPTKGTPRHGGLESETLRSSLHHSHRMIQNLKGTIHREKTEKLELKRMLQDARDELEQRRTGDSGSAAKRQKTKADIFKKPLRPDMLGGSRRPRTDVELTDDDWEDSNFANPNHARPGDRLGSQRGTDLSDAYQTANETDTFDTADERNTTESEAFMTGAESLAGDSTDELTETEDTASKSGRPAPGRVRRVPGAFESAQAYPLNSDEEEMQTPMQTSFTKFKLRNKQPVLAQHGTPESFRSQSDAQDSPATVTTAQSPPVGEQSLFAELGGMDEINSESHSTPARSSTMSSTTSTPGYGYTPSKSAALFSQSTSRPAMVDSSTMTEEWHAPIAANQAHASIDATTLDKTLLPSAFPLPPSQPQSPVRQADHSTQYTPQRGLAESPIRPTSSRITPPKTIWDPEHEPSTPGQDRQISDVDMSRGSLGYSGVLSQHSMPVDSPARDTLDAQRRLEALQADLSRKESELDGLHSSHTAAIAAMQKDLNDLRAAHKTELDSSKARNLIHQEEIGRRHGELESMRGNHATTIAGLETELEMLRSSHASTVEDLRHQVASHEVNLKDREAELEVLQASHTSDREELQRQIAAHEDAHRRKQTEMDDLRSRHAESSFALQSELDELKNSHREQLEGLNGQMSTHQSEIDSKHKEIELLRGSHAAALAAGAAELEMVKATHSKALTQSQDDWELLRRNHAAELDKLTGQISAHQEDLHAKQQELQALHSSHAAALSARQADVEQIQAGHATELEKMRALVTRHSDESDKKRAELDELRAIHSQELEKLRTQLSGHDREVGDKQSEMEKLQSIHNAELEGLRRQLSGNADELASKQAELDNSTIAYGQQLEMLQQQLSAHTEKISSKQSELDAVQVTHNQELEKLNRHLGSQTDDLAGKQDVIDALNMQVSEHFAVLAAKQSALDDLSMQLSTHSSTIAVRQAEIDDLNRQVSGHVNELAGKQAELDALHAKQPQLDVLTSDHKNEMDRVRTQISAATQLAEGLQARHRGEIAELQQQIASKDEEIVELKKTLETLLARQPQPNHGFSGVLSQDAPPASERRFRELAPATERQGSPERPRTAEKIVGGGLIGTAAGTSAFAASQRDRPIHVMEDQTSGPTQSINAATTSPLTDVSGNRGPQSDDVFGGPLIKPTLSATSSRERSPGKPGRPNSRTRFVSPIAEDAIAGPSTSPQRPPSVGSGRPSSILSQSHPPLPSDHKDVIAKASTQMGSPTRPQASLSKSGGSMGPPVMPASAMRRPKTPNESVRTAERVGQSGKRGTVSSQLSRRSSVSSFASELDERFNIRPDQQMGGFQAGPGTDPRMIQAITQTMIGEYLWKYTRKAGSKEMSNNRHRRYFWVHPYTRTLYWSDQDPQTAGKGELKSKSVTIESVRVVNDDNPMPPGLHRKSLEIMASGRKVKITASTGQRHDTWFNALSYLLHRGDERQGGVSAADGSDITNDDLAEFSVNGYGARLVPNQSRMSMSSYNSRTTSGTSRRVRQSIPTGATLGSTSSHTQEPQSSIAQTNNDTLRANRLEPPIDKDRTLRASSRSRFSRMLGSVTSRRGSDMPIDPASQHESSSIYNASVVSDTRREEEEEARRQREQNQNPGLEDVRACCDGKSVLSPSFPNLLTRFRQTPRRHHQSPPSTKRCCPQPCQQCNTSKHEQTDLARLRFDSQLTFQSELVTALHKS